jgi:uncharacterized protein
MPDPLQLALLFVVAVVAGFIDSVAGGGGLITLPALLGCGLPPQLALGTNKLQSTFGSAAATFHFLRAGLISWRECRRTVLLTAAGAAAGALAVRFIETGMMRSLILTMLLAVALCLVLRPGLGAERRPPKVGRLPFDLVCGLGIGFYDGFLGPGTGTFWAMGFVLLLGMDLVNATARTKLMNFSSNLTSLAIFAMCGQVSPVIGLVMGAGQWLGARWGSRTVMRRGHGFIRLVLLLVVTALVVKLLLAD